MGGKRVIRSLFCIPSDQFAGAGVVSLAVSVDIGDDTAAGAADAPL